MRRVVVPEALRVVRLAPGRKFTSLGRISQEVGWKYQSVVAKLEEKRIAKAGAYFERKKSLLALKKKAIEAKKSQLAPVEQTLAQYGF
jgi:large subunit ribosomal protein L13Ae